ncbi:ABC transporter substrate-binding protein [Brachybacterium sp. EE-P12]|uniref:ABC transporter substrate-binding protein n=1 Tax=Brachybacterium sp. EE-P12 TaxID=2306299 RepID=UPI000F80C47F|nr:extracellular solute-binding protein [Brachybacterium sp. EE-P12]
MATTISRRTMTAGLTGTVLTAGLAGCGLGGGAGGADGSGSADAGGAAPGVECEIPDANLDDTEIDRASDLQGEIRFATQNLKTDFGEFFTGLIESFQEAHPGVTITWEDTPQAEDFDSRMVTDAQTCVMADVINVPGPTIAALSQANLLMDLDVKAPGIGERFIPAVWEASVFGEEKAHTALPWYWSPSVITYNRDLMEEAGLDPDAPPTTFEEQYEMALQIADVAGGDYFAIWGNQQWNFVNTWLDHGAQVLDEAGEAFTFADDPFVLDWLTKLREVYEAGGIPKDSVTGAPNPGQQYNEGTLVFGTQNASFLRNVKDNAPDLYPVTDVAAPLHTGDSISYSGQYVAVSVTTQNAPLALAWADYVTTAENQLAWSKDPGVVIFPATPESLDDPFFTDQDESDPLGKARLVAAEHVPMAAVNAASFLITGQIQTAIMEALQLAITGGTDPQEALSTAQQTANDLLEKARS